MKMKIMFVVAFALLIPFVLAYSVQMNIDADVAFDTDVYACSDSACDGLTFETSGNSYSLVGSGDDYYIEFDYAECFRPHMYEVHVWGDRVGPNNYFIDLIKRDDCVGSIVSGGLSEGVIELGESVSVDASVHSAYDLSVGVPSTTIIPGALEDEYSSLIKVEFYADGVKIGEDEVEVLMGTDEDFELDWTPSAVGSYDITVVSSVTDCACSKPNPQTSYVGTVLVNAVPSCVENIVNGSWSAWVNVSGCVDNWMNQSKTMMESDVNSCGVFDDVLHTETRSIVCGVPCSENIVFGNWSAWSNYSGCSGGVLEQIRTRLEYDANSCGVFDDVIRNEMRDVNCSLPVCSVDFNCTTDYYEDRYCSGNDVYETFHDFSCVANGCVENITEEFVRECADDCDDGSCVSDEDNSWDDRGVVWNDMAKISPLVVLDISGEADDGSWIWLLWILLIIGILFLCWMILRLLSM